MTSTSPSSPEQVHVAPARKGLRVAVPSRRMPLAEAGELVQLSPYWRRRLADGDVVLVDGGDVQTSAQAGTVE